MRHIALVSSPRHWSIKTRSLMLFGGYVAALCAVYVAFTVYLLRQETAAAHDRLQQTAAMVAAEMDAYLEAGQQRLETVARLPGLVYGLRTIGEAKGEGHIAPWTTLHYLFFKSPVFTGGVFLVDKSGLVLWAEPPGRPWLGQTLADLGAPFAGGGGPSISAGLGADALLDRPHVIVTAPIDTPEGERAGTLGGVIDLTAPELSGILAAISTAQGRFAAVLDRNGVVLAGTRALPVLQSLLPAGNGADRPLLASAVLSHASWSVVAGQPEATALAEIWRLQRLLLWLGVALTLGVLAVGVPFVRGFLTSIEGLTRSADLMARGNLSEPVYIGPRHDELATLATAFERMRTEVERSRGALEQRLEEREELIRLKEEFVANISHELRTPLNVIIGYTDMLFEADPDAEAAALLVRIRTQSEHLFSLLRDLMTLSGLNTGRIALEVSPVKVPELLNRLTPLVDQLRQGRDVEVVWDCPASLPILQTDALRLEQVLTNLITNAFKFTPHGTIAIRARHEPRSDRITFEVADTGIGIPPDEIAHIFDEFRQVDGSMSREYGGIGLGLALVKKLTGLLHGDVAVTSHVASGSTFSVAIPVELQT